MMDKTNKRWCLAALLALVALLQGCDSGGGGRRSGGDGDCSTQAPAGLGCACTPQLGCELPLLCEEGVCVDPNAPNNSAPNNTNNPNANNPNANNPDPCEVNPADPACANNNTPVTGLRLQVGSADARSCEALVEDPNFLLRGANFGQGVQGTFLQRGTRAALAFSRKDDAAFQDGTITLQLAGDPEGASSLSLREVACFDKDAQPLAQPGLAIAR